MGFYNTEAPAPRDIGQESRDTLQAQVDLAPAQLAAAQQTQPGYDALSLQSLNNQLFGTGGNAGYMQIYEAMAPRMAALDQQSTQAQRAGDIASIEQLGGRATAAMLAANPYQKALLDRMNAMTAADLENPYALTAEQKRIATQSSRAAMAARGMGGTNLGAASEVLANYLASNQEAQRRLGNAQTMTSVNQSVVGDPFQQILGRSSGAVNQAMAGAGQGSNASSTITSNTNSQFNPFNSYASQLYGQNSSQNASYLASLPTGAQKFKFASDTLGSFIGGIVNR